MIIVRQALSFAGRNGPLVLFFGVLVGLVLPSLAAMARPLLGVAVFLFTLGAFLKVDRAAARAEAAHPALLVLVFSWTTFGVPVLTWTLLHWLRPEASLSEGMMLCMLAPPVGSAAAIAAMLGLSTPLALIASVAATALSPLYVPIVASWTLGQDLSIDAIAMTERLFVIVGGAALCAGLMRRFAGRFVANNPLAMTGIAVFGLLLVAIGAMHGMQRHFVDEPMRVAHFLALAFLINGGFQLVGALLFWPAGNRRALTVGLLSGNRNVTLAWAAAGTSLAGHPGTEVYLAMSVFPIFMLPLMQRWVVSQLLLSEGTRGAVGPGGVEIAGMR